MVGVVPTTNKHARVWIFPRRLSTRYRGQERTKAGSGGGGRVSGKPREKKEGVCEREERKGERAILKETMGNKFHAKKNAT